MAKRAFGPQRLRLAQYKHPASTVKYPSSPSNPPCAMATRFKPVLLQLQPVSPLGPPDKLTLTGAQPSFGQPASALEKDTR